MQAKDRIIVAIDTSDLMEANRLVKLLSKHVGGFKFGLELFFSTFSEMLQPNFENAIQSLILFRNLFFEAGHGIFMDVKFDDIPNTVAQASAALARIQQVAIFNVHASAGTNTIEAAVRNKGHCKVYGVTVLTSIEDECVSIFGEEPGDAVLRFASMLQRANADGVICSPQEAHLLRSDPKYDVLKVVTPGIRPTGTDTQDQKRKMKPREAILAGVDWMVIGRPIYENPFPVKATYAIAEETQQALEELAQKERK